MDTDISKLEHRDEPPVELLSGVLHDAQDLAVAEIDKLRAEAKSIGREVKIISLGALILAVAAIMLGTALSLGLAALDVPPWAAFGIVAIAFAIAGIVFLKQSRASSR